MEKYLIQRMSTVNSGNESKWDLFFQKLFTNNNVWVWIPRKGVIYIRLEDEKSVVIDTISKHYIIIDHHNTPLVDSDSIIKLLNHCGVTNGHIERCLYEFI